MAADLNIEHIVQHMPKWGWVAIAGGIGAVLYFQSRSSSSAPAAAASTADTGTGSTNTTTPTGTLCPSYAVPVCLPPGVIIFEADENGCQKPVCSSSLGGSTGGGTGSGGSGGSTCHSAPHGGHCVYGQNCPGDTFREIFSAVHQDPNCALQWNPTGAYLGLDRPLWPGFVVFY